MKKNWNLSLVLVCVVLGILLATSFNTQRRSYEALNTPRKKDLIKVIHDLEWERDELKGGIKNARDQIARHEEAAAETQGILSSYTKELEKVKMAAGLMVVKGKGLVITLADSQQYPKDDDPNNYVIHDYDLRLVVNSLLAGRAEAISVNGQRLISTSAIRCAGGTILINSVRLVSPYTIKAIGDQSRMIKALDFDDDTRRLLNEIAEYYGLQTQVEQKDNITVAGYNGGLLIESAKVIEGGE